MTLPRLEPYDPSFDTICWILNCVILLQDQLVMRTTLKIFVAFNIAPRGPIFRVVVGSQIMVPQQSLPHNDTPRTRTHNPSSNTICQIVSNVILPQN